MLTYADACSRMHVVKVMRAAVELRKLEYVCCRMLTYADACCSMHVVKVMRAAVELRKLTLSFSLPSHWPTYRSLEQVLVNHIHSFDLPSRASCVVSPLPLGTLLTSGRWRSVPKLQSEKLQSRNMQLLVCLISLDHRPEQLRSP